MFTRRVIMNIKPGSAAEAGHIFKDEVLPPLRGQKGMRHHDTFISPELSEAVLNSYWDTQESADSYGRTTYPAALKALSKVLEGAPQVETFGISSATFHLLTAPRRAAYRTSTLGKGVWPSPSLPRQPNIYEDASAAVAGFAKPSRALGGQISPTSTHATKRILEVGVYRPGDLTSEVTTLDDVDVRAEGDTAVFTGHATVKSRFKGQDFGSLYQLSKKYEKRQGRWRVTASRTARLGDE